MTDKMNGRISRPAETPGGVEMERWICEGYRRSGNGKFYPCRTVLMELTLGHRSVVRIRCPDCGTWSIRETVSRDTERSS